MSVKLIYHTQESIQGGISPFDKEIRALTLNNGILISCPYLGTEYLIDLLAGKKDWKIISDIVEWIKINSGAKRKQTIDFIIQNVSRIRNYPNLHSKVIISDNKAMIGSANFTQKGICERIEMSVLFEDEIQVKQLHSWFLNLWNESDEPDIDEVRSLVNEILPTKNEFSNNERLLTSNAPKVQAKLSIREKNLNYKEQNFQNEYFAEQEILNLVIKHNKIIDKQKALDAYNLVKLNLPIELRDEITFRTNTTKSQISFIIQNYLLFRLPYNSRKFTSFRDTCVYLIYPVSDIDNLKDILSPERIIQIKTNQDPFAFFDCIAPGIEFDAIINFKEQNWNSFRKACLMAANARKSRQWNTNISINWT